MGAKRLSTDTAPRTKRSMPSAAVPAQRTVAIPEDVARDLEARIRGTGFTSVDQFVAFVLARLLEDPHQTGVPFSEEEEKRLRERLRSLGYID